jgi:hypothetical protein
MNSILASVGQVTAKDWLVLLFGFLGGGLAGASFTQWIGWLRRPKLHLSFSGKVKGCIVDPPSYVLGDDGKPFGKQSGDFLEGYQPLSPHAKTIGNDSDGKIYLPALRGNLERKQIAGWPA